MGFKEYLTESVISQKLAKQKHLVHSSHNVWKDKQGKEYKYDEKIKNFKLLNKEDKSNKEITYFGKIKSFERYDTKVITKKMNLDTENIMIAGAILAVECLYGDGKSDYEEYKKTKDPNDIQNYYDFESPLKKTKTALAITGDCWFGGFGRTKEECLKMYHIAQDNESEDSEGDW
jgi:hypothetical protein